MSTSSALWQISSLLKTACKCGQHSLCSTGGHPSFVVDSGVNDCSNNARWRALLIGIGRKLTLASCTLPTSLPPLLFPLFFSSSVPTLKFLQQGPSPDQFRAVQFRPKTGALRGCDGNEEEEDLDSNAREIAEIVTELTMAAEHSRKSRGDEMMNWQRVRDVGTPHG